MNSKRKSRWKPPRLASNTFPILLASAAAVFCVFGWVSWRGLGHNAAVTLITGYLAIALLAITLLIGPVRRLVHSRSPANIRLRRRIGIAAAALSAIHTVIGLRVHVGGNVLRYFSEGGHLVIDQFRIANWVGLLALLTLTPALFTSADRMLASLGIEKWKRIQRSTLVAAPLAFLHALVYAHIRGAWALLVTLAATGICIMLIRLIAKKN
jgi:DMSO/TMAO reductase YedYZ heme-binding membrane subunit